MWCDQGFYSRTVVVIKLRRTSAPLNLVSPLISSRYYESRLAISSSILAYLGEENFESCDVMCIVWSFFCLPRNVASNAKLLKLGEFLNVHQMPELNTVSLSEPCCAEYFIAMHIALDQDVSLIRSGEAGTCSQGILLIVFFSGFLESSTSFLDSTRCRL